MRHGRTQLVARTVLRRRPTRRICGENMTVSAHSKLSWYRRSSHNYSRVKRCSRPRCFSAPSSRTKRPLRAPQHMTSNHSAGSSSAPSTSVPYKTLHRRIFAATSCQESLNNRAVALPADLCNAFNSIQELKVYFDAAGEKRLSECLDTCWYLLKGFQPVRERQLPTHLNLATTMEDFPQTYTVTKATHKCLLRAFSTPKIDSNSEAGHEG